MTVVYTTMMQEDLNVCCLLVINTFLLTTRRFKGKSKTLTTLKCIIDVVECLQRAFESYSFLNVFGVHTLEFKE